MIAAANHGWTMYPGLLHGAYECLRAHGSEALKARYLAEAGQRRMAGDDEPDRAAGRQRPGPAARQGRASADGSYALTGSKIFISGGEQDLTENIVHLVLARLPEAPPGTKGISLFLAPKILPDGSRNAIRCDGIEKKMGIKGSATCAMSFDAATGWLIGQPHRGLAAMFVMMNSARLHVAMQGQGHLEAAQQNALAYARERIQGRGKAIAEHPAMRRTLWSLRALAEGQRVIAYWTAMLLDESHHHPDASRRAEADALVGLLTPVAKAFFTDNGHRGADEALQVWGGYGFVHDYGIEQTVRDSRIAMIYEGTNQIQAIDLLQRKVLDDGGARLCALLDRLLADADTAAPALAEFADALRAQSRAARQATAALVDGARQDPEWPLRAADDYLRGIGLTLLAWAWLRRAAAALAHAGNPWFDDTLRAARFGVQWLLPEAGWRWQRVRAQQAAVPAL